MDTSELAGCYAPHAADRLQRQRSFPAAMEAAFAPCTGGGEARRKLGSARLGFSGHVPASWPAGGVGFVRALWMQVVGKVTSGSRSSSSKKQYGHEDYAWNFDDGGAAAEEPDYLPRSFSARYSRRRPAVRLAIPDVPHQRHLQQACG